MKAEVLRDQCLYHAKWSIYQYYKLTVVNPGKKKNVFLTNITYTLNEHWNGYFHTHGGIYKITLTAWLCKCTASKK